MSDSNRIRVSIVPEGTFGVTPPNPAWQVLATTGQSMRDQIGYQQSRTINNDRNVQDLIRLSKAAGGGIPVELTHSPSGEGLERLIRAAMAGTETASVTPSDAITANGGAKTFTRSTGSFVTDGIEVGDIVKSSGATEAAKNGYFRVTVVSALSITVEADANFIADEVVTLVRGARIKNGTTEQFFSVEVARLDLQIAQVFTGCAVDGMDFTIADGDVTTADFSLQASTSTRYAANNGTTDNFGPGTPTYTSPTVSPVLDSIGVPEVRSQGSAYAAKSVNMSLLNNVSPRTQIGALGAQSMRFGEFGASGQISAYLADFTELDAYADNTSSDIWLVMEDANSKGFSLSFPEIKYGDAGADTQGSNTDTFVDLAATALKDPTELCTARLQRWD